MNKFNKRFLQLFLIGIFQLTFASEKQYLWSLIGQANFAVFERVYNKSSSLHSRQKEALLRFASTELKSYKKVLGEALDIKSNCLNKKKCLITVKYMSPIIIVIFLGFAGSFCRRLRNNYICHKNMLPLFNQTLAHIHTVPNWLQHQRYIDRNKYRIYKNYILDSFGIGLCGVEILLCVFLREIYKDILPNYEKYQELLKIKNLIKESLN